jgi:dihydrofolate synthase/folylpolyglutamate synthase
VHVAGTNGKGSVATMLTHILKEGGFRVGKYTSPHLVSFTERITVNEKEITEEEVADITEYIRGRVIEKDKNRSFTFFDFTTALAFAYFRREQVDIAVIETGLGGRLDSTNVLLPLLSIITNVAYDHTDQLGSSLANIAFEKAGIIKQGVPVVSACEGISQKIIEDRAKELHCQAYTLNRDFSYKKTDDQRLAYRGISRNLGDVFVNLYGDHQLANCTLALCAAEILSSLAFPVQDDAILRALSRVTWQGRLEKVKEDPLVLLDAAHNPEGVHALTEFIHSHYRDKKKILVFGVMKDKDYKKMLDEIVPAMDTVILTKPKTERALSPYSMQSCPDSAIIANNMRNALEKARAVATEKDLILVTGSFYTIGEAKTIINEIF